MLSIAWLAFRNTVGKLLKDWRVIALILASIVVALIYVKFYILQHKLAKAQDAIVVEQQHSQALQTNLNQAVKINEENAAVITQLQTDKQNALASVSKLNTELQQTNNNVNQIKDRINALTIAPTQLTPYLSEAVKGVQELRDAEAQSEDKK
jgi:uncharacterized phage infection (PIP) family protein YhgE